MSNTCLSPEVPVGGDRLLRQGEGWRLGLDAAAPTHVALVGSDAWAIELTAAEWQDFRQLLQQLTSAMAAAADELMPDEVIDCEVESDRLWLGASGFPHAYDVRLLLKTGRGAEGTWPAIAVPPLIDAIRTLELF
ncbi:MAG: DUF1818 family protein [Cyanophyceae cyanobacterium]